jgi:hypothetical protein
MYGFLFFSSLLAARTRSFERREYSQRSCPIFRLKESGFTTLVREGCTSRRVAIGILVSCACKFALRPMRLGYQTLRILFWKTSTSLHPPYGLVLLLQAGRIKRTMRDKEEETCRVSCFSHFNSSIHTHSRSKDYLCLFSAICPAVDGQKLSENALEDKQEN